jgi:hypothetical protein
MRVVFKNGHYKDMSLKETALHDQYTLTVLGSIIDKIDDEYDIHMSSRTYEESGYGLDLDLPTISY